jgi:hypothetical protein
VSWLGHESLTIAGALLLCSALFLWRAERAGVDLGAAAEVALFGVSGALIGARLASGNAGLVSWGAYAGGTLPALAWIAARALPLRALLAAALPAAAAGIALARVGCAVHGHAGPISVLVPLAVAAATWTRGAGRYLIATGLIGDATARVMLSGCAARKNS